RTVLLVLLAASALVFIIACSNVANLILTRTVRREGELATRAALGASTGALRRMLLAESLLLCGAGAAVGIWSAPPLRALLAGDSTVITTLIALQTAQTGLDMRHVLTINVPPMAHGKTPQQVVDFYKEAIRRIDALPGVNKTAFGLAVPWRDVGGSGFGLQFSADGHTHTSGEDPRAQLRVVSPRFFAALGVPILSGRDFDDLDGQSKEPVAIVSETLAKRMFPNQDAVGRHVYWTDPVMQFAPGINRSEERRVGKEWWLQT